MGKAPTVRCVALCCAAIVFALGVVCSIMVAASLPLTYGTVLAALLIWKPLYRWHDQPDRPDDPAEGDETLRAARERACFAEGRLATAERLNEIMGELGAMKDREIARLEAENAALRQRLPDTAEDGVAR